MNIFKDQAKFMIASEQTVDKYNDTQYSLYLDLIKEEYEELVAARIADDNVEQLDALLDLIVVIAGAIHSAGFDGEGGWNEVIRSNMSKVDPETGKVLKRKDGKVLKPASFSPPNLTQFLEK